MDRGAVTSSIFSLLELKLMVAACPFTVTEGEKPGIKRLRPSTLNAPPGTSCKASRFSGTAALSFYGIADARAV